ncbi:MAG: aminotransferase class I/II-fold pyridoxal phosphate-dependent enzyme [Bacteroidales bacterium]|jgi:glycine C-acetyltransferase
MDLFKKFQLNAGPLGQYQDDAEGYFIFPQLEGEIGPHMMFNGKERLVWSINNYLGLANHPEVREADAEACKKFGMAYPMGARAMSGQTKYHRQLELELAAFENKEDCYLLNFGYQGMVSIIDCLCDKRGRDVIVYDAESHACILDGMRITNCKRFSYIHNDMASLEKRLKNAERLANEQGGGVLVITEGVFGMSGAVGNLKEIVKLKEKYNFRLLVDDAHGVGTMGKTGSGTPEHFGEETQKGVDIYFGTFAKSFAGIGAFVCADKYIIDYLKYNMRSQIYAKSLPMPMVIGALKRLEIMRNHPEIKDNLWKIVNALQSGLREAGFNLGRTKSCVTPVFLNGSVSEATNFALELREKYNIFCSVVVYPVIPKGEIIFRLIPTAVHTLEDVKYTVEAFSKLKAKLDNGEFETNSIPTFPKLNYKN